MKFYIKNRYGRYVKSVYNDAMLTVEDLDNALSFPSKRKVEDYIKKNISKPSSVYVTDRNGEILTTCANHHYCHHKVKCEPVRIHINENYK